MHRVMLVFRSSLKERVHVLLHNCSPHEAAEILQFMRMPNLYSELV